MLDKCKPGLIGLANAGILVCDGQERCFEYAPPSKLIRQRAFVTASFASPCCITSICTVLAKVRNASWMLYSSGRWCLWLSGCDGKGFNSVFADENDDGHTVASGRCFGVTSRISQCKIPDPAFCTPAVVDIDTYKLKLSCPMANIVSFCMWEDSWPVQKCAMSEMPILEQRLLDVVETSGLVILK